MIKSNHSILFICIRLYSRILGRNIIMDLYINRYNPLITQIIQSNNRNTKYI